MTQLGKLLIIFGLVLAGAGVLCLMVPRIPFLGKLTGEIHIKRDNVEIFIPLATSLVLSALLTGILWVMGQVGKK